MKRALIALACLLWLVPAQAEPQQLLQTLDSYPHAQQVSADRREVLDYEIGLGAMQKVRGAWRFKHSERLSGSLQSYTWQIVDGFSSREVADELTANLQGQELLFACEGRSCGSGAQWANRVFRQRILYGREDLQRYQVYRLNGEGEQRLLVFDAARTADRQYLHVELLQLAD